MTDWMKNFPEQEGETFVFRHYGLAPSVVFRNSNLSIGAKAVYGYLTTFVNGEQMKQGSFKAWPSRKRILNELNISVNTLSKYLKELKDANLIKVEQGRRVLQEGKQVYGNNLYIMQPYIASSEEEGKERSPEHLPSEGGTNSKCKQLKSCDAQEMNTSNIKDFSTINNKSNTISSTKNTAQNSGYRRTVAVTEESLSYQKENDLDIHALVKFWNEQGINIHPRLGERTKRRIQKALDEALEDYPLKDILSTIISYSKLYKDRRCNHKYRLVEFLEKRGYEHFLNEENWRSRNSQGPFQRDEFTYTEPKQDRSFFSFLDG